jgi:hypothetical protein
LYSRKGFDELASDDAGKWALDMEELQLQADGADKKKEEEEEEDDEGGGKDGR